MLHDQYSQSRQLKKFEDELEPHHQYSLKVKDDDEPLFALFLGPEEITIYRGQSETPLGKAYRKANGGPFYKSYKHDDFVEKLAKEKGLSVIEHEKGKKNLDVEKEDVVGHVEYVIILLAFLIFGMLFSL